MKDNKEKNKAFNAYIKNNKQKTVKKNMLKKNIQKYKNQCKHNLVTKK